MTNLILRDVSVLSAASDGVADTFTLAFASASLGTPTTDFPAPATPTTAGIHLASTQPSPLSAFSFQTDGPDPVGTSAMSLVGPLARPMLELGSALLNGYSPTSVSVDQYAGDHSTVARALSFGNTSVKGLILVNDLDQQDALPVLSLSATFETITTTVGATTACWSYVLGAAC